MKKIGILLALIISFNSCKDEKVELAIEKEKLVEIIADLHLAEEMVGKFREEDKDSVKALFLQDISQIHQVDTSLIFSQIKYVQDRPELGLEIYSEVYSLLEKHSKKYDISKKKDSKDDPKKDHLKSDDANREVLKKSKTKEVLKKPKSFTNKDLDKKDK